MFGGVVLFHKIIHGDEIDPMSLEFLKRGYDLINLISKRDDMDKLFQFRRSRGDRYSPCSICLMGNGILSGTMMKIMKEHLIG